MPEDLVHLKEMISQVKELAEYAKDMNIIIALETHGGPLTGTGKDSADTYVLDYIVHVHLKDQRGGSGVSYFPPLGEGEVNFSAVFKVLSRSEYSGPYSLEIELDYAHIPEKTEVVDRAIRKSIEYLKDVKPDLFLN